MDVRNSRQAYLINYYECIPHNHKVKQRCRRYIKDPNQTSGDESTMPEMKKYTNWISGRLNTVEEKIKYFEDITIKNAQNETQ